MYPICNQTEFSTYALALSHARAKSPLVASATSATDELSQKQGEWYLSEDMLSGLGVTRTGELVGLFSLARGRGDALVRLAVHRGATHLDCFDGYLPALYARNGFREWGRAANWQPGGPDVVYMRLVAHMSARVTGGANVFGDAWVRTDEW